MLPEPPPEPIEPARPECRLCGELPAQELPELGAWGKYKRFCSIEHAAIYGVYIALLQNNHDRQ